MGKRSWLDQVLQDQYLPEIAELEDSEQGHQEAVRLCEELRKSWAKRGFPSLQQQQSLMDTTRRTIKQRLGKNHFSLDYIGFSTAEYTEINDLKQDRVAERNTHCVLLEAGSVNALITRSVNLLNSQEWVEIAAALAVLTGRRSTEVLATAQFEPKTQYSVVFTGALKRGGEEQVLRFEIPTLCQAEYVLQGLQRLRQLVDVQGLSRQQINAHYGKKVADACDRLFADLLPTRPDNDTLYSHLFRAVYATIAVWFYCPVNVDATEFKAHCQGHFALLDETNPQLRRKLASSRHYNDFKISDGQGNIDGRQGIRLNWQGVEVLEVFQAAACAPQSTIKERKRRSTIRIWKEDYDRLVAMLHRFQGKTQADRVEGWLEWSERQLQREIITATEVEDENPVEEAIAPDPLELDVAPDPLELDGAVEETVAETQGALAPTVDTTTSEHATTVLEASQENGSKAVSTSSLQAELSTPLERKIDALIDMLGQFVQVQLQAQAIAHPAKAVDMERKTQHTRPDEKSDRSPKTIEVIEVDDAQPEKHRAKAGRRRGVDDELVDRAVTAIIAYNNASGRTYDEKWFITVSLLKKFTPNSNQRAAQRVLDERRQEVEEHHQKHQLRPDHNNRHKKHDATIIVPLEIN